jgi:hypothetical protein
VVASGCALALKSTRRQGDLEGAERFRKQAELMAVQVNMRQMFPNLRPRRSLRMRLLGSAPGHSNQDFEALQRRAGMVS